MTGSDLEIPSGSDSAHSPPPPAFLADVLAPASLFVGLYLLFFSASLFVPQASAALYHGTGLLAAVLATICTNRVIDRGRWRIGFTGGVKTSARESLLGLGFACAAIGGADLLIILTTGYRHSPGTGIDWWLVLTLFLPAAVHEEVLFRGYPFQKMAGWNRTAAATTGSAVFTLLHLPNEGITPLALINIFLAGLMLSCGYFLFRRLWFVSAVHLGWNILAGPVLGHEVSGFRLRSTFLTEHDPGPPLLTGGSFGIEGSIWTTVVEVLATLLMLTLLRKREVEEP